MNHDQSDSSKNTKISSWSLHDISFDQQFPMKTGPTRLWSMFSKYFLTRMFSTSSSSSKACLFPILLLLALLNANNAPFFLRLYYAAKVLIPALD